MFSVWQYVRVQTHSMQIFVLKCILNKDIRYVFLNIRDMCILNRGIYFKIQMQISILKFKISVFYDK